MRDIQNSLWRYIEKNVILAGLANCAEVLVLIHPIYLLLSRYMDRFVVWHWIADISALFYVCYLLGLVLVFAKNRLLFLDLAFLLLAVNRLFYFTYGMNLNRVVYLTLYITLAVLCIVATTQTVSVNDLLSNSNTMNYGNKGRKADNQNVYNPALEQRIIRPVDPVVGMDPAASVESAAPVDNYRFCSKRGQKLPADALFCDNCGQKL